MRNINVLNQKSLKNAAKLAKRLKVQAMIELMVDKDALIKTVDVRH